jgi:uncharacterized protein
MHFDLRAPCVHVLCAGLALCLAMAFAGPACAADEARAGVAPIKTAKKNKVVYHVTTDDQRMWNQSLNNIRQLQKVLGKDNVEIELVVNGWGIGMLQMESAVGNRIDEAVASGVKVVACEATMADRKLSKDDMLKSIGYVPGGVIEVMQKQQQGYAYLKP